METICCGPVWWTETDSVSHSTRRQSPQMSNFLLLLVIVSMFSSRNPQFVQQKLLKADLHGAVITGRNPIKEPDPQSLLIHSGCIFGGKKKHFPLRIPLSHKIGLQMEGIRTFSSKLANFLFFICCHLLIY